MKKITTLLLIIFATGLSLTANPTLIDGCTNPCALNYDPTADNDDGSCEFPSCDDGCDLTIDTYNEMNCECVNTPPIIDDGCPLTITQFDLLNCQVITEFPNVDDGCDLTTDEFDINNCLIINTPIDIDDGCPLTTESIDWATCSLITTEPDCDDGDPATADIFDATTCECINDFSPIPGCTNTCALNYNPNATFDDGSCQFPDCDDSCELTTDSLNLATCQCVFLFPDPDDGCDLTNDSFDFQNCVIINEPPNNCYFIAETCQCEPIAGQEDLTIQALNLYPAIANNEINLSYTATTISEVNISIIKLDGTTMRTLQRQSNLGQNQERLDLTDLSEGLYLINIQGPQINISKKFIKVF